jgi:hypothetical protein
MFSNLDMFVLGNVCTPFHRRQKDGFCLKPRKTTYLAGAATTAPMPHILNPYCLCLNAHALTLLFAAGAVAPRGSLARRLMP